MEDFWKGVCVGVIVGAFVVICLFGYALFNY
jgi:hypothetical protein